MGYKKLMSEITATEKTATGKMVNGKFGNGKTLQQKRAGRKRGQHKVIVRQERQRYFRLQKKWQPQTYHRLVSSHVL